MVESYPRTNFAFLRKFRFKELVLADRDPWGAKALSLFYPLSRHDLDHGRQTYESVLMSFLGLDALLVRVFDCQFLACCFMRFSKSSGSSRPVGRHTATAAPAHRNADLACSYLFRESSAALMCVTPQGPVLCNCSSTASLVV